uniref:Uncharacterized protein n=1 Tax=Arundo donax TaxID=35708 RepID=A0A0A9H5Y3_ARUDO
MMLTLESPRRAGIILDCQITFSAVESALFWSV